MYTVFDTNSKSCAELLTISHACKEEEEDVSYKDVVVETDEY